MLSRNALRQLMAQAASAGSLQAVYDAALRGVQDVLHIDRAALLAFDAGGTMRFVAWSGLSDGYRTAVDGHSPWSVVETAAIPLLVSDVEQDQSLTEFLPVLRRESIRALAFVPVQCGTRLLGKFMLYYREPHQFSESEVAAAEQVADHVAFAIEHHRLAVAVEGRLSTERILRERAEHDAALREANERRLDLALSVGRMGAWQWDIGSGVVTWSTELERIHGLEPGTFDGTLESYRRDVHPADADRLSAAIAGALQAPDAGYDIEYRIVRPDGMVRWLGATGRVILDSRSSPTRMIGICRDVTARKRADEASAFVANASRILATTLAPDSTIENLAKLVVPSLADWCIVQVTDTDGQLRPVEITHLDTSRTAPMWELLRRWPNALAPSGGASSVAQITNPAHQGRAERSLEQILLDMQLCSAMIVPLQARGRTLGALTFISAESKRIYDDADLRFAAEIASWAALALDNARLYGEACTAVRARDEMVAFVSHDLRNPLESIAAATAMLQHAPQSQTVEYAENIASIAHASTEMQRLVQDLVDVSAIEAGGISITRERVDLTALVAELQTIVAPQVKARGARLETAITQGLPEAVSIDRHRILQVLLNLVGNALKFGTRGGLVTLGVDRQDDSLRFWVKDSGAGIDDNQIPMVFDRFWRAGRCSGAGLGLAVAKGIVETHGGQIGVTSQIGAGSTFFFTLPLESTAYVTAARTAMPDPERFVKKRGAYYRVLLVDDDHDVVQSLVRLVRAYGHSVQVAFSGEEALQIAEHFRPQLVLMDVGMQGLNGYDTARRMRSCEWSAGVNLIAVTGLTRESDRRRALEAGFDMHLTKPVSADVLERLLSTHG